MSEKKHVYNRFYTPEKWEQCNKFNKDLINDFLLELKSQGKKKTTIDQYFNDLRIICIYILDELDNKPFYKLKKRDFRNLVLFFKEKGMSNARANRLMSAVRSCLEYASNEDDYADDLEINYAGKVKGLPKEEVRDIVFLEMEEIEALYNLLIEQGEYQDALLLALGIDSAARRNELFQIEKDSITEDGNFTNFVIGKRGKKFRLMYHDMTKKAYKLYMEQRGEDDIKELWTITEKGVKRPASYDALYSWVTSWRKMLVELGFEYKEFNAHSLRHSALELLSTGDHYLAKKMGKKFELNELMLLANHSDISTTNGYLKDKSEDELLNAFGLGN